MRFRQTLTVATIGVFLSACRSSQVLENPQEATLSGHRDRVVSLAFSPDGRTLVSASEDGAIKLWDVASKEERHTLNGHSDRVVSVAVSPDGRLVASGSYDKTV